MYDKSVDMYNLKNILTLLTENIRLAYIVSKTYLFKCHFQSLELIAA